jgi:hypothetical protein
VQQEDVDPDPARSCGLCNRPELQASLPGIRNNIRPEPMNSKSVCDLFTDLFTLIISLAVMQPVLFFEPSPFIFCHDMIAKYDRRSGFW